MFNLKGPVLDVDTACASAASAFEMATRSILTEDCDQAIVAAYNCCFCSFASSCFGGFGMTSMDGKCKCLDASANGYQILDNLIQPLSIFGQRKRLNDIHYQFFAIISLLTHYQKRQFSIVFLFLDHNVLTLEV